MKYLLDVNVLLALLDARHALHDRAERWAAKLTPGDEVLLCPWCEIAFVRVALATRIVPDVSMALHLLAGLQAGRARRRPLADDSGAAALPAWVATPAQTGDGHLLALAAAHGAQLATLDASIPGAHLLP